MLNGLKAIFFDFDGTVIDSADLGFERALDLVRKAGYKVRNDIKNYIVDGHHWSKPGIEAFRDGFDLSEEEAIRLYAQLEVIDQAEPAPLLFHAFETISWLRKIGLRTAIVTSRKRENLMHVLEYHKLDYLFDHITALDDCGFCKPDPRVLLNSMAYLEERGIKKEQCLMIGDSPQDILCAIGFGIHAVGALSGVYSRQHLMKAGLRHSQIIDSIADLTNYIETQNFI